MHQRNIITIKQSVAVSVREQLGRIPEHEADTPLAGNARVGSPVLRAVRVVEHINRVIPARRSGDKQPREAVVERRIAPHVRVVCLVQKLAVRHLAGKGVNPHAELVAVDIIARKHIVLDEIQLVVQRMQDIEIGVGEIRTPRHVYRAGEADWPPHIRSGTELVRA